MTCFTRTKVQTLTLKLEAQAAPETRARWHQPQMTCFTSTKVRILTLKLQAQAAVKLARAGISRK
jgi:hypothetical protein